MAKRVEKVSTKTSIAGSKPQGRPVAMIARCQNVGLAPQRGFSLMELVVVIVLIGLVYLLLPKMVFGGVSGPELKSNVRAVATGLRLARDTAIISRRQAQLTINLAQREFNVSGNARIHKLNDKIDLKLYTAQADLVSDKVGAIRFYPDGSSNGGRISVGAGGRNFDVTVDWLTGRVSVSERDGNIGG